MTKNRKKAMKFILNNSAFSLMEMIVVIAVFGILAGASLTMMGQIRYANTERVIELIDTELSKQQIQSMSKSEKPYIYIYPYGGAYYMRTLAVEYSEYDINSFTADGVKLCNDGTKIYWSDNGGAEELLDGDDFIKVVYNRAGSFADATNVDTIRIEGNSSHVITLVDETGKHVVD